MNTNLIYLGACGAKIQQKSCLYAELFVPLQRSVE